MELNISALPLLPYAGTSGWTGTDTSRDAVEYLDTHGITAASQRGVIFYLLDRRARGATVKEIRDARPNLGHHGRISGALSVLHREGWISRLTIRREHCYVYVLNDFVNDRPTSAPKSPKSVCPEMCPACGEHDRRSA